jgi:histone H4
MSGKGKQMHTGGKGADYLKRFRKVGEEEVLQNLTKPAIRRLARRGGVKRIAGLVYEDIRTVTDTFLKNLLRHVVTYADHAKRKTVRTSDVIHALKHQGRTIYGV